MTTAPAGIDTRPFGPTATEYAYRAILFARAGDLAEARKSAAEFGARTYTGNTFIHALNAVIALEASDLATAERELTLATDRRLFTTAIRADCLMRKGQKTEAAKLCDDVMTSSIKSDGVSGVDYLKLMARMHVIGLGVETP